MMLAQVGDVVEGDMETIIILEMMGTVEVEGVVTIITKEDIEKVVPNTKLGCSRDVLFLVRMARPSTQHLVETSIITILIPTKRSGLSQLIG
jgi:hypothetical protein